MVSVESNKSYEWLTVTMSLKGNKCRSMQCPRESKEHKSCACFLGGKCAKVNRVRDREVTLVGCINTDTQSNVTQRNAVHHKSTYFLFNVCMYRHILHVTAYFSKDKKKKKEKKPTSVIRGAEAAKSNHNGSRDLPWLDWEPLDVPWRARGALTLHSFFSDTNQIQQHKHIRGCVGMCVRVCVWRCMCVCACVFV